VTASFGYSYLLLWEGTAGAGWMGGFWTLSSGNQRISQAAVALSVGRGLISPSMGSADHLSAQPIYHAIQWARIQDFASHQKANPSLTDLYEHTGV